MCFGKAMPAALSRTVWRGPRMDGCRETNWLLQQIQKKGEGNLGNGEVKTSRGKTDRMWSLSVENEGGTTKKTWLKPQDREW